MWIGVEQEYKKMGKNNTKKEGKKVITNTIRVESEYYPVLKYLINPCRASYF